MTNEWKEAIIDALVVREIYKKEHEEDPRRALNDLIVWEQQVALFFLRGNDEFWRPDEF